MKRGLLLASAAIVAMVVVFSGAPTTAGPDPTVDARYERAVRFQPAWEAGCGFDQCGIQRIVELAVTTPPRVANVDVVATLSLDHKTSPSDGGDVFASFREGDLAPATRIDPGPFPIMSPSPRHFSSTTLGWVKRGVPAAGRSYTFYVSVVPRDGDNDDDVTVKGRKLSFVIDIREAGP